MVDKCPKCGEPKSREVQFGGNTITLPLACKCDRERQEELEREIAERRKAFRNGEIIRNGYLDTYYAELTFDIDDSPDSKASKDLKRYCEKWETMKEKNIGLLLMGSYGTGKTFYAYPGCAAGRGFDELGEKGVLCGTVSEDGAEMRFVPMANRRYEILTVDITGRDAALAMEEALGKDCEKNIYRVILTGETDETGVDAAKLAEKFL